MRLSLNVPLRSKNIIMMWDERKLTAFLSGIFSTIGTMDWSSRTMSNWPVCRPRARVAEEATGVSSMRANLTLAASQ